MGTSQPVNEILNMADINEILKKGIRFGPVRGESIADLMGAASQLLQLGTTTRKMLQEMGKAIARDSLLFNDVVVDKAVALQIAVGSGGCVKAALADLANYLESTRRS